MRISQNTVRTRPEKVGAPDHPPILSIGFAPAFCAACAQSLACPELVSPRLSFPLSFASPGTPTNLLQNNQQSSLSFDHPRSRTSTHHMACVYGVKSVSATV